MQQEKDLQIQEESDIDSDTSSKFTTNMDLDPSSLLDYTQHEDGDIPTLLKEIKDCMEQEKTAKRKTLEGVFGKKLVEKINKLSEIVDKRYLSTENGEKTYQELELENKQMSYLLTHKVLDENLQSAQKIVENLEEEKQHADNKEEQKLLLEKSLKDLNKKIKDPILIVQQLEKWLNLQEGDRHQDMNEIHGKTFMMLLLKLFDATKNTINRLNLNIETKKQRLQTAANNKENQDKKLKKLEEDIKQLTQNNNLLLEQRKVDETEYKQQQGKILELQMQNQNLQNQLAQTDGGKQKDKIEQLLRQISEYEKQIELRNRKIETQDIAMQKLNNELTKQNNTLPVNDNSLTLIMASLQKIEKRLTSLEDNKGKCEDFQDQSLIQENNQKSMTSQQNTALNTKEEEFHTEIYEAPPSPPQVKTLFLKPTNSRVTPKNIIDRVQELPLNVNVKNIFPARGGVIIKTSSQQETDKLQDIISENTKRSDGFTLIEKKPRLSRIMLHNVPDIIQDHLVYKAIMDETNLQNTRYLTITKSLPSRTFRKRSHIFIMLPQSAANELLKKQYFYIGASKTFVTPFVTVPQCSKCLALGHTDNTCSGKSYCSYCAQGHRTSLECRKTLIKDKKNMRCLNCITYNKANNDKKLNTHHCAFSRTCELFQEAFAKAKKQATDRFKVNKDDTNKKTEQIPNKILSILNGETVPPMREITQIENSQDIPRDNILHSVESDNCSLKEIDLPSCNQGDPPLEASVN